MIYNPITLAAPLYLQNVLGARAATSGLLLAILPLSTAVASPLSGRLADWMDASTISICGLAMIVAGIAAYSFLGTDSDMTGVALVLALIGAGVGFFTPANQKVAFAAVLQDDYGVLGAMLSSFGTAAGTIGMTMTVALMELDGGSDLWTNAAAFAGAQQFAFKWLVPCGRCRNRAGSGKEVASERKLIASFANGRCPMRLSGAIGFASDYPQDFTGVNTDTGKGIEELDSG